MLSQQQLPVHRAINPLLKHPCSSLAHVMQIAVSPLSLLPVLLVAIIAFILGHFLKDRLPFGKA